jgi:trimeric autotransporter adhesin
VKIRLLRFFGFIVALTTLALTAAGCGSTTTTTYSPQPVMLSSITITPASPANLVAGSTQMFTALGSYSDGSTADLTAQASWNSSATNVASISSSGLATGVAAGTTDITASLSGITCSAVALTVTPAAATLASIRVTPSSPVSLITGATQQFTATGAYSDGSGTDVTSQVTWISSDTKVATISASGLATGIGAGSADITASAIGVTNITLVLTVAAPAPTLSAIVVTPSSPDSLTTGSTQQFTATGTYSDSSSADITAKVNWVSSDTGIASISSSGVATGVAAGLSNITAALSGVTNVAVQLTVIQAATLTSITVTPVSPNTLATGSTQQFTATGTYSDSSSVDITANVTWLSSDTAIASISSSGLATGVGTGLSNITASLSGVTSVAVGLSVG